jgi:hypothetical protein
MARSSLVIGSTHSAEEVRKFPCKKCGAGLNFEPGQQVLECAYCGHKEAVPVTPQAIQEYDLDDALLRLPRTEGWGTERRALQCEHCGATTTFGAGQVAGQCAFCGSSKVVERSSSAHLIRPESLVPFAVERNQAVALFRRWISRGWFRPNNLKDAGQLARISGAYLPFWTYDAVTSAHWTADAGYYYYVTETYEDTDAHGNKVTCTRQVQHTRWQPCSGSRQDVFDDELVCASRGLPPDLIEGICPFDLDHLVPYEAGFLSGFVAEEYQIDLAEGWATAKSRIQAEVYGRCSGDVPGDTQRNLQVNTAFSQMTYKHLLLPVWVAAYLYNNRTYRFLVNGQNGRTSGEAPVSWWKVSGLMLLIALIALITWLVFGSGVLGGGQRDRPVAPPPTARVAPSRTQRVAPRFIPSGPRGTRRVSPEASATSSKRRRLPEPPGPPRAHGQRRQGGPPGATRANPTPARRHTRHAEGRHSR